MPSLTLKPTHKAVTAYYDNLAKLGIKPQGQADASADGARLDNYGLNHGLFWEAKDSAADLDKEIKHKFSMDLVQCPNQIHQWRLAH